MQRELHSDYPLPGVTVRAVASVSALKDASFKGETWQVNESEFALQVYGVGSFYVRKGSEVEYSTSGVTDPEWVTLYLNGQVLVALLHQRRIVSFHAGSFVYKGRGVIVLGSTGSGKSSVTVAFALEGSGFMTDDLTPVLLKDGRPYIWPLTRAVRIREESASQLGIDRNLLREAERGTGKQYLSISQGTLKDHPLHTILKIETGDVSEPQFSEPEPAERFSFLRSEICSWEMLAGMPETEAEYLQQLVRIVEQVQFVKVIRPAEIRITDLHKTIEKYLNAELIKK